jgi:hypothetical protein
VSDGRTAAETWRAWRAASREAAERRWTAAGTLKRAEKSGKQWLAETRTRLIQMTKLGILAPREQGRVAQLDPRQLDPPDRNRLGASGLDLRRLFAFAVAPETAPARRGAEGDSVGQDRVGRSVLALNPGKRLREGKLSFLVFIDESTQLPVGMNLQLRGIDPTRDGRPTYFRYDLDVVQMGAGPVAHFRAHWHAGDDPEAVDAEDHDPRLPSLPLDPVAVIEILVETFFPDGPADLDGEEGE